MPLFNQKKKVASATSGHAAVTCGPTDVCKTPGAPSPLPLPYPNLAPTAPPGTGYCTKVLIQGGQAFVKGSKTSSSQGDQAGSLGGVKSGVVMGGGVARMGSCDVLIGGAPAVRTGDISEGNCGNAATGSLMNVEGTVVGSDPVGSLCLAFADAVVAWCQAGKGHRNGTFNDYVFDALQKMDLTLWNTVVREKPIGVLLKSGIAVGFTALAAAGDNPGHVASKIIADCESGAFDDLVKLAGISWSLFRIRCAQRIHALFNEGNAPVLRVLFPDAEMSDGTPIEIKRPCERESFPGQRAKYAQASCRKSCISLDCTGCNHTCTAWKGECG